MIKFVSGLRQVGGFLRDLRQVGGFLRDLRQVGGFFRGLLVSFTNKTVRHEITEILLKVALMIISHTPTLFR